ncbi:MAG: Arm DNA-binding domain-containing protein, partial [Holdemanella sp.]|nr:Arm DNA-binding domain-containing protein [Holdemanella sp.]
MAIKKVGRENYAYYGKYKKYDGTYKNYYKSGYRTKKEASRSEEAFLLGIKNCDNEITFGELVDMFNERSISMNIKESTIVGYESYYKNHLEYYFSKKKVSKITPQEIELWKMDMIKKKKHDGNTYSSSTINHAKNVLSKYLSYASQLGIIQYNPCNKVSKYTNPDEIIRKRNDDENFWEIDEFRKFIDSVDDPYWNLVFTFLFDFY